MMSEMFDVDQFDPPPDPDLICCICQGVLNNPVEIPCRHVYCRSCIEKWLKNRKNCPTCRRRLNQEDLKPVLPILLNVINRLTRKCKFVDFGCDEKIALGNYENHIKSCDFELLPCRFPICGGQFCRKHLKSHEEEHCVYREILCTKDCEEMIPIKDLESHDCLQTLKQRLRDKRKEENKLEANLSQLTGHMETLKKELADMREQMSNRSERRRSFHFSDLSTSSTSSWDSDTDYTDFTLDDLITPALSPQSTENQNSRSARNGETENDWNGNNEERPTAVENGSELLRVDVDSEISINLRGRNHRLHSSSSSDNEGVGGRSNTVSRDRQWEESEPVTNPTRTTTLRRNREETFVRTCRAGDPEVEEVGISSPSRVCGPIMGTVTTRTHHNYSPVNNGSGNVNHQENSESNVEGNDLDSTANNTDTEHLSSSAEVSSRSPEQGFCDNSSVRAPSMDVETSPRSSSTSPRVCSSSSGSISRSSHSERSGRQSRRPLKRCYPSNSSPSKSKSSDSSDSTSSDSSDSTSNDSSDSTSSDSTDSTSADSSSSRSTEQMSRSHSRSSSRHSSGSRSCERRSQRQERRRIGAPRSRNQYKRLRSSSSSASSKSGSRSSSVGSVLGNGTGSSCERSVSNEGEPMSVNSTGNTPDRISSSCSRSKSPSNGRSLPWNGSSSSCSWSNEGNLSTTDDMGIKSMCSPQLLRSPNLNVSFSPDNSRSSTGSSELSVEGTGSACSSFHSKDVDIGHASSSEIVRSECNSSDVIEKKSRTGRPECGNLRQSRFVGGSPQLTSVPVPCRKYSPCASSSPSTNSTSATGLTSSPDPNRSRINSLSSTASENDSKFTEEEGLTDSGRTSESDARYQISSSKRKTNDLKMSTNGPRKESIEKNLLEECVVENPCTNAISSASVQIKGSNHQNERSNRRNKGRPETDPPSSRDRCPEEKLSDYVEDIRGNPNLDAESADKPEGVKKVSDRSIVAEGQQSVPLVRGNTARPLKSKRRRNESADLPLPLSVSGIQLDDQWTHCYQTKRRRTFDLDVAASTEQRNERSETDQITPRNRFSEDNVSHHGEDAKFRGNPSSKSESVENHELSKETAAPRKIDCGNDSIVVGAGGQQTVPSVSGNITRPLKSKRGSNGTADLPIPQPVCGIQLEGRFAHSHKTKRRRTSDLDAEESAQSKTTANSSPSASAFVLQNLSQPGSSLGRPQAVNLKIGVSVNVEPHISTNSSAIDRREDGLSRYQSPESVSRPDPMNVEKLNVRAHLGKQVAGKLASSRDGDSWNSSAKPKERDNSIHKRKDASRTSRTCVEMTDYQSHRHMPAAKSGLKKVSSKHSEQGHSQLTTDGANARTVRLPRFQRLRVLDDSESSDDTWSTGSCKGSDQTVSEEIESDSNYEVAIPKSTRELLDEYANADGDSDDTWSPGDSEGSYQTISEEIESDSSYEVAIPKSFGELLDQYAISDGDSDDTWSPGEYEGSDLTVWEEIESDSSYEVAVPKSFGELLDQYANANDDSDDTWSPRSNFQSSP